MSRPGCSCCGRSGPLNDLLRAWGGDDPVQFNVYSREGMILIEGLLWSPMAFLLLSAVFGTANADYEDAARMCGAGIFRRCAAFRCGSPFRAFAPLRCSS